jgi:hypothetical protein
MGNDGDAFDNYPIWRRIPKSNPPLFERLDRGAKPEK